MVLFGCCTALGLHAWCADYNFSYRAAGDAELRPVQIFDDGRQTYFQWRATSADPAILAELPEGPRLISLARQGPYLVAPLLANAWQVRFGQLQARVTYAGAARTGASIYRPTDPVSIPQAGAQLSKTYVAPLAIHGAATPIAGDADEVSFAERDAQIGFAEGRTSLSRDAQRIVLSALGEKSAIVKVVIVGRGDASAPDGLSRARAMAIRDEVVSAGVALDKVVIREAPAFEPVRGSRRSDLSVTWIRARTVGVRGLPGPGSVQPPEEVIVETGKVVPVPPAAAQGQLPPVYHLKKNELIHLALQEWAQRAGWEFVWQHPGTWKAMGDTSFDGRTDVTQAVSEVVRILRAEGKPVRLRISEGNRVMEVLSAEVRHE
jgi:outer membrane protein OmpA-like peptidoglycan-associated protein